MTIKMILPSSKYIHVYSLIDLLYSFNYMHIYASGICVYSLLKQVFFTSKIALQDDSA